MPLIIIALLCSYPTLSSSTESHPKVALLSKAEIDTVKMQAKQGNSASLVQLGDLYYFGRGINHDIAQSIKYYQKASELG
ncbi:MAG TPA: SEL1-like repeat protein, partial [Candidatus Berkiella sp.]|nr:SEL1-like repeat protein [Candidatus Berkiella sp.]